MTDAMRLAGAAGAPRRVVRVKICGITRVEDGLAAEAAGADAVGLNFFRRSPRVIDLARAREISDALGPFIHRVGIFVSADEDQIRETIAAARLTTVQLHGDVDERVVRRLRQGGDGGAGVLVLRALSFGPGVEPGRFEGKPFDGILLDSRMPGSGEAFAWEAAPVWRDHPRLVLAGGLRPSNVGEAVRALRPYAVDVATGVESSPGVKDAAMIQAFVRAARTA